MPTTTNFGWTTPADTDLVKDGASAIRTLGNGIDASLLDLKGGTTGQVLAKATNTDLDFTWVAQDDSNAIQNAIVDAKGDLISATAADTPARLAVGANGTVLTADSAEATGLKWATPTSASGPAFSVTRITSNQSLTQNTYTKLQWNSEDFDTDNAFDSTTNYRFTPLTAGYYQINVIAWIDQNNATFQTSYLGLYKNGSLYKTLSGVKLENYNNGGSALVYLNGSTDYLEVFGYSTTAAGSFRAGSPDSCFSGVWIRS